MKKYFLIIITALSLFSCENREHETYIPKDKFIAILADIHLADAYYSAHYNESKSHNDSINFYNSILKNHGYTKAQFDTTLKYYSIHSEEFNQLYEEVITALGKTEQENNQVRPVDVESKDIWRGKNSWYLPEEGSRKKIPVNLELKGKGKYIITFTCKVYPNDQSKNPRLSLYFAADSGSVEKRDSVKTVPYVKDARTSVVSLTKELKDSTYTHLRGFLYNHDDKPGKWKKHGVIEGLKVHYLPE